MEGNAILGWVDADTGAVCNAKPYNPLNSQVGGSHYNEYTIQPIEYAMANNLDYCQANAIKYITRFRDKNGLEDLKKAIHNIEILIELEYTRKEDIG